MTLIELLLLNAGLGALGGVANCFIANEFVLPSYDREDGVWRPGWIGNVFMGAIAALLVAAFYGPLARLSIVGGTSIDLAAQQESLGLTLGQLFGALGVGMSGATILTQLAKSRAEQVVRSKLVTALRESGVTGTGQD